MADLSEKDSSGSTKLVGSDAANGVESNYAKVDASGNQYGVISNPSGTKAVSITGNNHLRVSIEPVDTFYDKFDSAIDANLWTQAVAGSGAISSTGGSLVMVAPTANSSAVLTSAMTFEQRGNTYLEFGCNWMMEANPLINPNVYRFWGMADVVAPTYTVPQNNAVGFELSGGVFAAVVYANGTKIYSQSISTAISDGLLHRFSFLFNTQFIYFYVDTNELEVASANGYTPGKQIMPIKLMLLTGASAPGVAPVYKNSAVAIADRGRNGTHIKDSKYPHRVATVDAVGSLQTNDVAGVSGVYGSLALSTTPALLKVGASALANRKCATFDNTLSQTVYWGYDASVSSTAFAGRIFKDQQASWSHGPAVTIYLVLASGSGTGHISEAS